MHYNLNNDELKLSSEKLFNKIKNKEIKTNISDKFKLKDASKAHMKLESRNTTGSIVIKP